MHKYNTSEQFEKNYQNILFAFEQRAWSVLSSAERTLKKHLFNNVCKCVCVCFIFILEDTFRDGQKVSIKLKMDTEGKFNFKGVCLANENKVSFYKYCEKLRTSIQYGF